jgi:hypothetical protein
MSFIPRVTENTRESVARQFDDLGPESCVEEITADLRSNNPELLDMAEKCARSVGDPERVLVGFCMFYRLLTWQLRSRSADTSQPQSENDMTALPRVSADTREFVAQEIQEKGSQTFTDEYTRQLEFDNPELLQMAHNFASRHAQYLPVMQGFALLWACLVAQLRTDRTHMH